MNITWQEQKYLALVDLIRRTGPIRYRIEHTDEANGPVGWVAIATYRGADRKEHHMAGGGMSPVAATHALAETVVDGGRCVHCGRFSAVEALDTPLDLDLGPVHGGSALGSIDPCWYRYDPELKTYRRSCEGDQ